MTTRSRIQTVVRTTREHAVAESDRRRLPRGARPDRSVE